MAEEVPWDARSDPATRLGRLRGASTLTRAELAKRLNVTPERVADWENDRVRPTDDEVVRLSEWAGVSVAHVRGLDAPVPRLGPVALMVAPDYEELTDRLLSQAEEGDRIAATHSDPEVRQTFEAQAAETRGLVRRMLEREAVSESLSSRDPSPWEAWWSGLEPGRRESIIRRLGGES
jgi:transcriptional regulator with XRE-family HTH domain